MTRTRTLFIIISLLVGSPIFGGCNAIAPASTDPVIMEFTLVPSRTLAEARVIPMRNAALSFSMPGIVEEVLVEEGETAAAGDVIARQKGVDKARAGITQAEVGLLSAQKDLENFTEKSSIATADAELALAKALIELNNARDARKSLDFQQVSNTALDGLRATYFIALDDFKEAEDLYEPYKDRGEKDLERASFLNKLANARLAKDRALYNLNKALEMPDPEKIAKADARLSLAEAAVANAQDTVDKVTSGPDPAQLAILEAGVKNAEAQVKAAQSVLHDLEIIAPFTGKVISNDLKPGQAVSPAVVVMLGDTSKWQVETTDLVEQDIINIQPGDPVSVSLDALPAITLSGTVNRIKQIGLSSRSDITYTVLIDLIESDPRLLWNMKAFVSFEQ